jgi:hypothetical protein
MFLSINATTHVPLPTTFVSDIFQTSSFPKEKKNRNICAYKKNGKGILDKAFNTLVTMKEQMQIKPTSN